MKTVAIAAADLKVDDVITVLGVQHVVATVGWADGYRVWTSSTSIGWDGQVAKNGLLADQIIHVERPEAWS